MGIQGDTKSRRERTKYSMEQLHALERSFLSSQYPDTDTMEQLADLCQVSTDKISTWFQNRRSKFKRQSKDTNISWMRQHVYQKEPSAGEDHVLSAPISQSRETTSQPSSNLHYKAPTHSAFYPPPTPVYPPALPHDMFSDIIPALPEYSWTNQTSADSSSPDSSLSESSSVISPLQDRLSSPQHTSSPEQSFALDSSPDSSGASLQTTPPQHTHYIQPQQFQNATQVHHSSPFDVRSIYINQMYQWHYIQTFAHCMYRQ